MHDVTRVDLSQHTTLRLGGHARQVVTATEQNELVEIVRGGTGPMFLLAGGSNVVVADDGVQVPVVLVRTMGVRVEPAGGRGPAPGAANGAAAEVLAVTAEAGQPWDDLVAFCVEEGLSGVECLSGIPGSAGATPIQNVGAYGQEVAETIASVRVLDRQTGAVLDLAPDECGFAYRSSRFKHSDQFVVLSVRFHLHADRLSAPIRYAELARALDCAPGDRAPLAQVRSAVLALRAGKGMVLDPADPDTNSAGSFFTNPVLTAAEFALLRARAGVEPPAWPAADGTVKVSAAWLIERAGFTKGYDGGHPGVALSTKHTLALTNRGTGTTAALLALAREIRDGVSKAFDVRLHPEPVLINCTL